MIGVVFSFGNEAVEVRIEDSNCYFRTMGTNGQFATIENIKLDKKGSLKEHPDLKDNPEWKEETIKRFKEKMKSFDTETQRMNYIIKDLMKHGYKPKYYQKSGGRQIKIT